MLVLDGREHPRRGQAVGVAQRLARGAHRLGMGRAAVRGIEPLGDRRALLDQLQAPVDQRHRLAAAAQRQARLAAARGRQVLVVREVGDLLRRVVGTVAQQAVQQEHVEEAHRLGVDAHGLEGIEVHEPDLDVLHAALAQRMQRALAGVDHALGADRAVELVLDLQQAGAELVVVAAEVADADGLVGRPRARERVLQRGAVALEAVVAHGQRGLRVALVAQAAHAQRGAVRHEHAAVAQRLQLVRAARDEARAQRRRGAEQVQQQEGVAAEVADQREVLLARDLGQRPVVVDARDGLHAAAVAVAQAHAVDALGAAHVRRAVAADRNGLVGRQAAGHARDPHALVAELVEHAVGELVDPGQLVERGLGVAVHARDQLELRLAEVGRDVRMGQRRAERERMGRQRELAVGQRAQAFLLDAAPHALQPPGRERTQPLLQSVAHIVMTHQSSEGLEGSTAARALLVQGNPLPAMLQLAIFSIASPFDSVGRSALFGGP